jgi:TolA-binding protein
MDKRRTRHWSWLALFLSLTAVSSGCEMPQSGGSTETAAAPSSDEAERTRKMEEKAAEIERHAQEIQNMTGTEQEKIDAVNKLDQERRELQELQDSGR